MSFLKRDPNASLAFAVLSDLHMTHRGEGLQKLSQHLALYSRMEPKLDAHVFSGDIIYQHDLSGGGCSPDVYEEPYTYLKLALDRYASDIPLVYAIGNHEYPQGRHEPELLEKARALHESHYPIHTHKVIKGYHFITLGLSVNEEQEKWVMHEVRSALRVSGKNPVFVVYHIPIDGTVWGSNEHPGYSEKLSSFLLSSRRIVNICGHIHTAVEFPSTLYQRTGGATVIHAPMSGVGYIYAGGDNAPYLTPYQSRSLFFEVKGSTVLVHKIDNLAEKEIGKPWVIEPEGKQYYTASREKRAKKPAFPKGTCAKASVTFGGVAFFFDKAICPETEGQDDSAVPTYRFDFIKGGEKVKTVSWHSDFCDSFPGDRFEAIVKVALDDGLYTVRITPVSFFGKEGRSISAKLRVSGGIPAPLHNPYANVFAMI